MTAKRISGTKEWSVESVNCLSGCSHDCRYCYARADALWFGRIKSAAEWSRPVLREKEVTRRRRKVKGPVMFPTTHDITPEFLEPCLEVIRNILEAGNRLLIVSKPHFDCIEAIVRETWRYQEQILFRFTIGAMDDELLGYWEPGAPTFQERLEALQVAWAAAYETSVSCEPLLDSHCVQALVAKLAPCGPKSSAAPHYITDTIWIGKMNQVRARCVAGTSQQAIRWIEAGQTDRRVREIYEALKDHPKVRWKDSYKRVLGLQEATAAGQDV